MKKNQSLLKTLLPYAGKRKYFTYLACFLAGISAILEVIPYYYIWKALNEVVIAYPGIPNKTIIIDNGLKALLFALLALIVYVCGLFCSHYAAFRVARNLRLKMIEKVANLSLDKFNKLGSGKINSTITECSAKTENFLAHITPDTIRSYVTPGAIFVMMMLFDYRLGLISLLPIAISFLVVIPMMSSKSRQESMKMYQNALLDMSNNAVEYVRGIKVVKIFQQSVHSFAKFKETIDNYTKYCIDYTNMARIPMSLFMALINGVFVFLIAAATFISGNMTITFISDMLFYIIFVPIISIFMGKILFSSEARLITSDVMKRINELLNIDTTVRSNETITIEDKTVTFQDVYFKYPETNKYAISNINLTVKPGEKIALVGPSGGGKTTIASLLAGFYTVTSGKILLGKNNINNLSEKVLANNISYVFQDSHLLKRSIKENLLLAKEDASEAEINQALKEAQCIDIIDKLPNGVDTIIGTNGVYLSGGELQRIAIARAILKNAPIIILDEATAFADPENEYIMQKAFAKLTKNKMVIMIAHRLTSITNVNRIYVLDKGKITESGTHAELLKQKGAYNKLWHEYQKAIKWKVAKEGQK